MIFKEKRTIWTVFWILTFGSLCVAMFPDNAVVNEFDAPIFSITNGNNVDSYVQIHPDTNTSHTIQITPTTNGHYRAHVRVMSKHPSPPLPPQLSSSIVYTELRTNWSDFPPDFVVVPKDPLPEGARRQWGTITVQSSSDIVVDGQVKRAFTPIQVLTNHLMRIVEPVVRFSAPVPAVPTNTTNF